MMNPRLCFPPRITVFHVENVENPVESVENHSVFHKLQLLIVWWAEQTPAVGGKHPVLWGHFIPFFNIRKSPSAFQPILTILGMLMELTPPWRGLKVMGWNSMGSR